MRYDPCREEKLLKVKIVVALQNELGQAPKEENLRAVNLLIRSFRKVRQQKCLAHLRRP
jgi:hypothetical protein